MGSVNSTMSVVGGVWRGYVGPSVAAWVMTSVLVVVAILGVQLVLVRPRLGRRTDRVLAGTPVPHSRSHHVYVALEAGKCTMLIISGVVCC